MKIAIIGCGFAGLSSAIYMARKNHHITLIDKFNEIKSVGAGILIQPSSSIVLKDFGIYDNILNQSEKVTSIVGLNHHRKRVFNVNYQDYELDSFGMGIQRHVLFNDLYKECLKFRNINFVLGFDIAKLEQIQKDFDLVIVATGSHSILRKQVPIKQKYNLYPYGCLWGSIKDEENSSHQLSQFFNGSKEMYGILPSGFVHNERSLSIFWSLPIHKKDSVNLREVYEKMYKLYPNDLLISKIKNSDLSFAVYADVWMEKYNYENIVFLGDCAHAMSPQLGQGANMALLDSYYLNKYLDSNNIRESLEKYTNERKTHLKFYQQASKFLTPFFQSENLLNGIIRDSIFSIGQYLPPIKYMSSQILVGKKQHWFNKEEIKY
jgi:2-polyprenyl-6-methoxyphenol hydroxylase-like FAD-dependent oxidoreductase